MIRPASTRYFELRNLIESIHPGREKASNLFESINPLYFLHSDPPPSLPKARFFNRQSWKANPSSPVLT